MGKFEIKKDKAGKFRFNLKAGNGQVILTSEAYNSKSACENGIESVRKNSQDTKRFVCNTAKDGRTYFVLKATNGQEVGRSQMYKSDSGLSNGVISVQANAPQDEVRDLTS